MDVDVRKWLAETLGRIERKCDGLERQLSGRTKPLLTVEEAAAEVGRTPYTIRRWISERRLRADRIQGTGPRGRLLIPRLELEKIVQQGLG